MSAYRKTKYASVYVRHEKGCPAEDGERCRCEPSYRARHRQHGHSPTFRDIHEANGWLTDAKRGRIKPKVVEQTRPDTFAAVAEQWRTAVESGQAGTSKRRPYSENAWAQYTRALEQHILPFVGDRLAAELDLRFWQSYVDHLRSKGLKTNSINAYVNPIRAIYKWACSPARGLLPVNAIVGVELPPADETPRDRVATPAEFRRLLAALQLNDRVIWSLAGYATLRACEIDRADWSDVDWIRGGIYVPESKSDAGRRWTPLAAPLRAILTEAWDQTGQPENGRIVKGSIKGARSRVLGCWLKPRSGVNAGGRVWCPGVWERQGLKPIGLHESRHTANSFLHAAGVPLKAQAAITGHADATLTLRTYTHNLPGAVAEAGRALDAYLEGAR